MPNRTPKEYTEAIYQAIRSNYGNLMAPGCMYHGKDGALRLAREYGYGLGDWPESEYKQEIGNSYSYLLVRLSDLKPAIDAKPWAKEIVKSIATRKEDQSYG